MSKFCEVFIQSWMTKPSELSPAHQNGYQQLAMEHLFVPYILSLSFSKRVRRWLYQDAYSKGMVKIILVGAAPSSKGPWKGILFCTSLPLCPPFLRTNQQKEYNTCRHSYTHSPHNTSPPSGRGRSSGRCGDRSALRRNRGSRGKKCRRCSLPAPFRCKDNDYS